MHLPKQLVRRSARLQALHTCAATPSEPPPTSPPPAKRARKTAAKTRDNKENAPPPKAIHGGAFGTYEATLWQHHARIVGIDEAGRGPLAGPVVAAACSVPAGWSLPGVADSKTLSPQQREELYEAILQDEHAIVTTSIVDAPTIDELNILQATLHGMHNCVVQLPDHARGFILVDGPHLPVELRGNGNDGKPIAQAVIKGDRSCMSIAAASIVAKVVRDRIMDEADAAYPQYGFKQHKGYPTAQHRAALVQHGPCPLHRRSYAPVAAALSKDIQTKE